MSDDYINAKTLQVIANYSMAHDVVLLDGVTYVSQIEYEPYYSDNGARLERERIIALLEDEASQAEADSTLGLNIQSDTIRWCIALIKGENK